MTVSGATLSSPAESTYDELVSLQHLFSVRQKALVLPIAENPVTTLRNVLLFWNGFIRELKPRLEPYPWCNAWLLLLLQQMILYLPSLPHFLDIMADKESQYRQKAFLVRGLVEALIHRYLNAFGEVYLS